LRICVGDILFLSMCEPALPEPFEQIAYLDKEACEALPQHQLALFALLRWFHELPPLRRAIMRIIFPGQVYEDEKEKVVEERETRDTFSPHSPVDRVSEDRVDGVDARGAMEESSQVGQEEQGEGETGGGGAGGGGGGGGGGHVEEGNTGDAQGGRKSAEGGLSESNGMEQSAAGATSTARETPANPARSVELRPRSIRELELELRGAHNSPAIPAGSRLPAARPVPAQPAHYRTRNDFLQHRRQQQEEVQEDVAPAMPLSMAMEQEALTAAATTAEMTKGAQVAALQIFGAPSAVDVTVEALLAPNVMEGMERLQFEGCWRLSASVIRRACNRFLNCTYLDVKGAVSMDDTTLKHIASVCHQLQLLQIGGA
jgi:hypothetical protein